VKEYLLKEILLEEQQKAT